MRFISLITICFIVTSNLNSLGNKELVIDASQKLVVGLVLDSPGLANNQTNISCYDGLQRAVDEGLVTLRTKTSKDKTETVRLISEFVREGVDLIYAIGETNKDILINASDSFNDVSFVGIDVEFSEAELKDNLIGVTFKEKDGGFLAGLVAGSLTYTYYKRHPFLNDLNKVGVIRGKNDPDLIRYETGFFAGVKKINQSCEIISINLNSLSDQEKGYNALFDLKKKGVDVVFSLAGDAETGIINAAKECDVLIITTNRMRNEVDSVVLTGVSKNISVSAYLITKSFVENRNTSGANHVYGLKEGAISLSPYYSFDKYIPKSLNELVNKMISRLINGSEKIPDSIDDVKFDPEKSPIIE